MHDSTHACIKLEGESHSTPTNKSGLLKVTHILLLLQASSSLFTQPCHAHAQNTRFGSTRRDNSHGHLCKSIRFLLLARAAFLHLLLPFGHGAFLEEMRKSEAGDHGI
jgi:hypothetical protein